jgi:gluconate 5-dehydrogenase
MQPSLRLFDLSGRTALVTGASAGIGRAIAEALAGAGARVVLVARRAGQLEEAAAALRAAGAEAAALPADLSRRDEVARLAATQPLGAPAILVNAAGINPRKPADAIDPADWDATIEVNLTAPFLLARALVPGMRAQRWGRIINVASLQSVRAFPDGIAYGASKGGIVQLTRAMAEAWARDGITANAIAPGFFPTALTAPLFADHATAERLAAQTMVGRNGRLADLHGAAVFLASEASAYVAGQTLFVDGGFSAR